MLDFALTLLLTAGAADCTPPTDSVKTTVSVTSGVTGSHTIRITSEKTAELWGHGTKTKTKSPSGNRPVPGPLPLALLALGVCGVGGARWRRRRKTAK